MRICAACDVSRVETLIVGRSAFVGSLGHSEKILIEKFSVFIVGVEDVEVIKLMFMKTKRVSLINNRSVVNLFINKNRPFLF